MLKVNEEAILNDYSKLKEKQSTNIFQIKADAKAYAQSHGFDETQTNTFVDFVVNLQNNGLTKTESSMLEIFNLYIDEVEEPTEEPAIETPESIATPETTIIY